MVKVSILTGNNVSCFNKRLVGDMPTCHGNQEPIDTMFDLLNSRIEKWLNNSKNVSDLLHIFSVSLRHRDMFSKDDADKLKQEVYNNLNQKHNLYECYCNIKQYEQLMGVDMTDVWHCFSCQFDKAAYNSNKELVKELRRRLVDRVGYKIDKKLEV